MQEMQEQFSVITMEGMYAGNAGAIFCRIKEFITTKNMAYYSAL